MCAGNRWNRPHTSLFPPKWEASVVFQKLLRALYHLSDLFFLPFVDAVANNAIVESIACGVPVVVSDVGSLRDYVDHL